MAANAASLLRAGLLPVFHRKTTSNPGDSRLKRVSYSNRRLLSMSSANSTGSKLRSSRSGANDPEEACRKSLQDYFEEANDLIRSDGGGGPPRWFSPLECGARSYGSPLLLFLPGIDGVGLGLIRQHHKLGKSSELLPNQEEGRRLRQVLQKCEIRNFHGSGHFLFLEDGFDLVSVLKGTYFYRRGRKFDYVSDFMPVTRSEFSKFHGRTRVLEVLTGSVMFSTSVDGKIMRGLDGIPSEGPVLIVGNHMLLGFDLVSLPDRFFAERNIILRGMGHPLMFARLKDGLLPDISRLDSRRMQGGVPVSAYNLHKLLSSNSHVLLYPGGIREAMHRKGEEYTLFWPENPEFVRIAAKFGATIIPFGVVGADDVAQVVFDYNDQMKIPLFRSLIESLTSEAVKLRADADGELANQDLHIPAFFPKIPGRFYYYFGTPIKTKGRMNELKDKEKSRELYAEVKSEVKRCIAFLKEKREYDPYRGLLARLKYQINRGFGSEVPTFDI